MLSVPLVRGPETEERVYWGASFLIGWDLLGAEQACDEAMLGVGSSRVSFYQDMVRLHS